jgi:two-component system CheB/CheR fusion protein
LLSVQVWDTGIGIPATELQAIFEEYHQVDNSARERGRGLGLGLAIVQRLSLLLKHPIRVKSTPGKGSVFAIDIEMADDPRAARSEAALPATSDLPAVRTARTGAILVIDDDPEIRELLEQHLTQIGHRTTTAADAAAALDLVARHRVRPDLILADFNLPNAMTGLETATELRERLHRQIPTIILTGDISTDTLREIMLRNCVYLHKPVRLRELDEAVQRLLPAPSAPHSVRAAPELPARAVGDGGSGGVIFVVDDDAEVRGAIRSVLEADDRKVEEYASCEAFLDAYRPTSEACLLVDAYLPGMDGLTLLRRLQDDESPLPAIMITGNSDVAIAVEAMKAGATDFIEKPVSAPDLLACVARALEQSRDASKLVAWREAAADQLATLTPRQRDIMQRVLAGDPSKNIAADLGISQRTVENHRAAIMRKTGSKSLPALARLVITSASAGPDERHRDRPAPAPA